MKIKIRSLLMLVSFFSFLVSCNAHKKSDFSCKEDVCYFCNYDRYTCYPYVDSSTPICPVWDLSTLETQNLIDQPFSFAPWSYFRFYQDVNHFGDKDPLIEHDPIFGGVQTVHKNGSYTFYIKARPVAFSCLDTIKTQIYQQDTKQVIDVPLIRVTDPKSPFDFTITVTAEHWKQLQISKEHATVFLRIFFLAKEPQSGELWPRSTEISIQIQPF